MTDLTTTHLQHLLERATPGPWKYEPGEGSDERYIGNVNTVEMCIGVEANGAGSACSDYDLNLAALAPQLAGEVLWMRKQLASMRKAWLSVVDDPKRMVAERTLANHAVQNIDYILGETNE